MPWRDVEVLPRYKNLYEAIRVKDMGMKGARNEDGDPLIKIMKELCKEFGLTIELRVVKRTITIVDEVVDEAEVMQSGKS